MVIAVISLILILVIVVILAMPVILVVPVIPMIMAIPLRQGYNFPGNGHTLQDDEMRRVCHEGEKVCFGKRNL